ncbi:type VII secretion integral membrane protein EccD [Mycobacterium sp.]|uniref:type VII secretion integral membrane protein EccD n=1 Tax=Mycobacterium sp. TaxID=1785 RepID=UPI003C76FF45
MARTVTSDICRIGVQFESGRLDFVLPADFTVTEVIPPIVDHVAASSGAAGRRRWDEIPSDWQLSRTDGRPLAPRASLRDNGVRDGDVLWLGRVPAAVAPPPADDAIAEIASSLEKIPRWTPTLTRVAVSVGTLCCTGLIAYALLRAPSSDSPVIAGLLSAVALTAAVAYRRMYRQPLTAVILGACAAASATVAGYLLVPGGATAPKLMLASAVSATVSVLASRCIGRGTAVFSGLASFGFSSAAAAWVHLVAPVDVAQTGAVLAAAAAGLLVLTPRLAISTGRVPIPRLPGAPVRDDGAALESIAEHASHAHAIITGLVCGFSAAAALGASLAVHGGAFCGVAFAAAIGVMLALRAGTHVDVVQVAALLVSGASCFAAVFIWSVGKWAQHAHWIALGAAGIAAASTVYSSAVMTPSPLIRRCVDLTEYAALGLVIPLACWVCGVFAAVRGLSF